MQSFCFSLLPELPSHLHLAAKPKTTRCSEVILYFDKQDWLIVKVIVVYSNGKQLFLGLHAVFKAFHIYMLT